MIQGYFKALGEFGEYWRVWIDELHEFINICEYRPNDIPTHIYSFPYILVPISSFIVFKFIFLFTSATVSDQWDPTIPAIWLLNNFLQNIMSLSWVGSKSKQAKLMPIRIPLFLIYRIVHSWDTAISITAQWPWRYALRLKSSHATHHLTLVTTCAKTESVENRTREDMSHLSCFIAKSSRPNGLEDMGHNLKSPHGTHRLMLVFNCAKYGRISYRIVHTAEQNRTGGRTNV